MESTFDDELQHMVYEWFHQNNECKKACLLTVGVYDVEARLDGYPMSDMEVVPKLMGALNKHPTLCAANNQSGHVDFVYDQLTTDEEMVSQNKWMYHSVPKVGSANLTFKTSDLQILIAEALNRKLGVKACLHEEQPMTLTESIKLPRLTCKYVTVRQVMTYTLNNIKSPFNAVIKIQKCYTGPTKESAHNAPSRYETCIQLLPLGPLPPDEAESELNKIVSTIKACLNLFLGQDKQGNCVSLFPVYRSMFD